MRPVVDESLCIGCGTCEELCPDVFEVGDDGFSHVIAADPVAACEKQAVARRPPKSAPSTRSAWSTDESQAEGLPHGGGVGGDHAAGAPGRRRTRTARDGHEAGAGGAAPARAGLVLATLILVATVANLNLSVANVALPSIAKAFDSSQTMLDLVAVGYSLGLAAIGAVPGRPRRSLRPQADAGARHERSPSRRRCWRRSRRRTRCSSPPACSAGSPPAWRTPPRWR